MALLGPAITVACRTAGCDQNGIKKEVRAVVLDLNGGLLDWPRVACGSCRTEPVVVADTEEVPR